MQPVTHLEGCEFSWEAKMYGHLVHTDLSSLEVSESDFSDFEQKRRLIKH
jgi:hypothetical protein